MPGLDPATVAQSMGPLTGETWVEIWVVVVVVVGVLLLACGGYYFFFRRHSVSEVAKMSYLGGPMEWAADARREGRISNQCRVEVRGPALAKKAHRVRASEPGTERSAMEPLPAAPHLDPDVLLNVCYAPNVCYSPGSVSQSSPRGMSTAAISPPAASLTASLAASFAAAPRAAGTCVVDLSEATESLLRGESASSEEDVNYQPDYAPNTPRSRSGRAARAEPTRQASGSRSSGRTPGGLSAVVEEDRERTWGQDSQATWSEELGALIPAAALPLPPPVSEAQERSTGESSGAMLRI